MFDYSKLCGRIVQKVKTKRVFARLMGLSEQALFKKLSGQNCFKQTEIVKACNILSIENKDIPLYFFTYKVQ